MSGACVKIAEITANAAVQKAAIQASVDSNPFAIGNKIVGAISGLLGGQNESSQMTESITNNRMRIIQDSIIKNNCANNTSVNQTNSIVQSPECLTTIGIICRNPITGIQDMNCVNQMGNAIKINGINQSNNLKAKSQCQINAALQALSTQESTITNVAALKAIQDAENSGAKNKTTQADCTEVNSDISDEKYLQAYSECVNKVKTNQLNLLNTCSATNISQANDADLMNNCLVSAGIISDSSQGSGIKNDTSISSEQKAIGIGSIASLASLGSSSILIVIVIIIVIVAAPMLMGNGDPNQPLDPKQALKFMV